MSILRSELICPVFGQARELPVNILPTYQDVLLCYLWISRHRQNHYQNMVSDTSKEVSELVMRLWKLSSLPTIPHRTITTKIKAYHDKYRNLMKPYKERCNIESYKQRIQLFKDDAQSLFDISLCKCSKFDECSCKKQTKVPVLERAFLSDQRSDRKMIIGNVDLATTKLMTNLQTRKRKYDHFLESAQEEDALMPQQSTESLSVPEFSSREPLEEPQRVDMQENNQRLTSLSAIAKTLDRFGISDRAAAAIVSATLQDAGLITNEDLVNVVDRSKIRRARERERNLCSASSENIKDELFGLYFDGRKDKTLTMIDSRRKTIVEEHISLVKEPGSVYIGHLAIQSGKAAIVSRNLKQYLDEKDICWEKLEVIGCDGTVINTGFKGGVIRCLELEIGKPLQWFICQLHANELSLRHLFEHLDGTTSGPRSFTGPIGKDLKECENLCVISFNAIECLLPEILNHKDDLSTDQKYLYDICRAIDSGSCNDSLAKRNPGKIVHSRWLTMANRILRLYLSSDEPSENLKCLVEFILKVYAPMWFNIKTRPHCIYGSQHLHQTIKLSRYLAPSLKTKIDAVIQRNGYFGHPENIILAMLADERTSVKILALRRILKARNMTSSSVRTFVVPKFNFDAEDYIDIINWSEVTVTEPPLLKTINNDVIFDCIMNPELIDEIILPRIKVFPCHTQATERCVKVVTEASAAVCGLIRRDGFIKNRIESRKIMPVFDTKKHFKLQ